MEKNKPVRICALTTISKAMEWFLVDSMRNLSQNGYQVTLICSMDDEFKKKYSDFAECISLPMSRGVSVKDLLTAPLKLCRIFRKKKFDIIYYTTPNVSLYASLGGLLAGIKKRCYNQCGLRYVSFKGIKRKIFWLVEKITCALSTDVRAQSPLNMQFALDEGLCRADKISVVGIGGTVGVDLKQCDAFDRETERKRLREKYGIPQDAFLFGYVGRINADKGINELLEAFVRVQKKYNNVYLAMVGMIDDTNPVSEDSMKTAGENPAVIMTGDVPSEQVYPHMAMFDVLTHPTYREGFGKALQEAMGMGVPIITTDVPGPSEVVEDGISGILAQAKNASDLAEKMELMYRDADLRSRLAKAGRKRAERYFDRPLMLNNILVDLNKLAGVES